MHIPRDLTLVIHHVLDQWLPPFIRDSRLCMYPLFWILFGSQARVFMDFKEKILDLDQDGIRDIYLETAACNIKRKTDLNQECLLQIEQGIVGSKVLDIACGQGYLAGRLSRHYQVTAADMNISVQLIKNYPEVHFQEVQLTKLPFEDNEFDTVLSTHTLEHIPDIQLAVKELRRVARKRLIIVVPRQRPYKYTFDLHLHFFPYPWSLGLLLGQGFLTGRCELVGGDWLYAEDI